MFRSLPESLSSFLQRQGNFSRADWTPMPINTYLRGLQMSPFPRVHPPFTTHTHRRGGELGALMPLLCSPHNQAQWGACRRPPGLWLLHPELLQQGLHRAKRLKKGQWWRWWALLREHADGDWRLHSRGCNPLSVMPSSAAPGATFPPEPQSPALNRDPGNVLWMSAVGPSSRDSQGPWRVRGLQRVFSGR